MIVERSLDGRHPVSGDPYVIVDECNDARTSLGDGCVPCMGQALPRFEGIS